MVEHRHLFTDEEYKELVEDLGIIQFKLQDEGSHSAALRLIKWRRKLGDL